MQAGVGVVAELAQQTPREPLALTGRQLRGVVFAEGQQQRSAGGNVRLLLVAANQGSRIGAPRGQTVDEMAAERSGRACA